ncbi:aminotransferase class I/II-fold pyridoxal phosphate-dependent enzyme, partial [Psychromonas arctica]
ELGAIPFFDFAYQRFGHGVDEDAQGLSTFAKYNKELLIANSFSKTNKVNAGNSAPSPVKISWNCGITNNSNNK